MNLFDIVPAGTAPAQTYVQSNLSPEELINQIEMDSNATAREKRMIEHVEDALGQVALKDDEIEHLEADLERIKEENIGLERHIEELEAKVAELEGRIATAISELQPTESEPVPA